MSEERFTQTSWRYHVHALRDADATDTLELMETFERKREAFEYARAAARRNQEFTSVYDTMAHQGALQRWVINPKGMVEKSEVRTDIPKGRPLAWEQK